ncbi:hypothetical protein HPP92_019119 [Vanilla planifolia]|uniref:Uncharacterized protein n=1 Tax=Vanilla planifolia TaxID=51239 RepID=A0A835Q674_VANPL|nr:hypothetical protein HPP92_019631 [Vanilla planifolia]KAG0464955.1 hypothetical protein HPP92_019119 [Vanilla planifolia]
MRLRRSCHPASCRKVENVASCVKGCFAMAFFASLERCSCVKIAVEDEDVVEELLLIDEDDNQLRCEGMDCRAMRRKMKECAAERK